MSRQIISSHQRQANVDRFNTVITLNQAGRLPGIVGFVQPIGTGRGFEGLNKRFSRSDSVAPDSDSVAAHGICRDDFCTEWVRVVHEHANCTCDSQITST